MAKKGQGSRGKIPAIENAFIMVTKDYHTRHSDRNGMSHLASTYSDMGLKVHFNKHSNRWSVEEVFKILRARSDRRYPGLPSLLVEGRIQDGQPVTHIRIHNHFPRSRR